MAYRAGEVLKILADLIRWNPKYADLIITGTDWDGELKIDYYGGVPEKERGLITGDLLDVHRKVSVDAFLLQWQRDHKNPDYTAEHFGEAFPNLNVGSLKRGNEPE